MKSAELRKKTKQQLQDSVAEMQKKLNDIRFNLSGNRAKNAKEIRAIKKDLARTLTIINEPSGK